MGSTSSFRECGRKLLSNDGRNAHVILFVTCQIGFVSRVSDREQAFQANGVEGTICVSSVWK